MEILYPMGIEILGSDIETPCDKENGALSEAHAEDSDGVSVITESDTENVIVTKRVKDKTDRKSKPCNALRKLINTYEKTPLQVRAVISFLAACSLAAIVGLGAGHILNMDSKCTVSSAVDLESLKVESNALIDQVKELSEVKGVLNEIKESILQVTSLSEKHLHEEKIEDIIKIFKNAEKHQKRSSDLTIDPDIIILEQLQICLDTVCSVIKGIEGSSNSEAVNCKPPSVLLDLMAFKRTLNEVTAKFSDNENPAELRFLRDAEDKVRNICRLLLADLSETFNKLTMRVQQKLNNVRRKLNKRLCLLRDTMSNNNLLVSLSGNNSFLMSCDLILKKTYTNIDHLKSVKDLEKQQNQKTKRTPKDKSMKHSCAVLTPSGNAHSISDNSIPDITYPSNENISKKKYRTKKNRNEKSNDDIPSNKFRYNINGKDDVKTGAVNVLPFDQNLLSNKVDLYTKSKTSYPKKLDGIKEETCDTEIQTKKYTAKENAEKDICSKEDKLCSGKVKTGKEEHVHNILVETKHNVSPSDSDVNVHAINNVKSVITGSNEHSEITLKNDNTQHKKDTQTRNALPEHEKEHEKECPMVLGNNSKMSTKKQEYEKSEFFDSVKDAANNSKDLNKNSLKRKNHEKSKKYPEQKNEIKYKREKSQNNLENLLNYNWQIQRSRSREKFRERDRASEWYFNRANARQNIRENIKHDENTEPVCNSKICDPSLDEDTDSREFSDYWLDRKDPNLQKHSANRFAFKIKKMNRISSKKYALHSRRR
ncbi:probable DNA repair protein RAD50 isoform X2 [Orussus abietinus]|uniref:probable DNA repair protein RAD50 isoform X2 n=1 Tax=Orussus abietinus TaxID=222816 RepID=UPI0006264D66|nr:probable DNA repair protein RAD50 isoform X2 [Orussus abietinus]